MKKIIVFSLACVFSILLTVSYISCGGGGGGDDDGGGDTGGTSAPATLNQKAVDDTLTYIANTIPGCTQGMVITANKALLKAVPIIKSKFSEKVVKSLGSNRVHPTEATDEIIDLEGTCLDAPGSISGTVTSDDDTGDLSGDLVIDEFCQDVDGDTVEIDGDLTFDGNIDPDTADITQFSASSSGIAIVITEDGVTSGSVSLSFSASLSAVGNTTTVAIDSFSFTDAIEGTEVNLDNFSMTLTEGESTSQVELSGTIDVLGEGSVQFATDGPLTLSDDGESVSGTMLLTGADGTQIVVTILDGAVEIAADTDGDGEADYFPDDLDCSELSLDDVSF